MHFSKIQRYSPEVFFQEGGQERDIPYDSVKALAQTIQSLKRPDLLEAWDRLVQPQSRSRIVSCVYGNTFPLKPESTEKAWGLSIKKNVVVGSFPELIKLRQRLETFDDTPSRKRGLASRLWSPLVATSSHRMLALLGVGVLGVGVVGLTMATRNKKLSMKR
jgi:hypothetical protein